MGRIPNIRRLRARSAEEQMLATMLVAGLVFAAVSLVAFLRPGGSTSAAARGPQSSAAAGTNVADGSGNEARTRTTHTSSVSGSLDPGPGGDLTQRLQGLFASVLSPLGFTTNLPRLDPLPPGSVPIQTVSAPGSTPGFPSSFPPLPGHLPPPVSLPPVTDTLPPTTDTLPPTTVVTLPPTTLPPTTLPPTTLPPTTQPTTTTLPPTTDTLPPTTDTLPPTTDTLPPTTDTLPPTTDTTAPPTTDTTAPATTVPLPLPIP